MTAIARKVQIGTAACAIAVAAALTPAAVAQADPAKPEPTRSLGRSAGLISEAKRSPAANSSQSIIIQNVGWFRDVNFFIVIVQVGPYGTVSA
jgi:hypothetical protein